MRRWGHPLLLAAMLLVTSGCLSSIHPWFPVETQHFDERLLGVWESDEQFVVVRGLGDDTLSYRLGCVNKEDGVTTTYRAGLARIAGELFLDLAPLEEPDDDFLHASHWVFRITLAQDSLVIFAADDSVMANLLVPPMKARTTDARGILVPNDSKMPDDLLMVTDSESLERLLAKSVTREDCWAKDGDLYRRRQ